MVAAPITVAGQPNAASRTSTASEQPGAAQARKDRSAESSNRTPASARPPETTMRSGKKMEVRDAIDDAEPITGLLQGGLRRLVSRPRPTNDVFRLQCAVCCLAVPRFQGTRRNQRLRAPMAAIAAAWPTRLHDDVTGIPNVLVRNAKNTPVHGNTHAEPRADDQAQQAARSLASTHETGNRNGDPNVCRIPRKSGLQQRVCAIHELRDEVRFTPAERCSTGCPSPTLGPRRPRVRVWLFDPRCRFPRRSVYSCAYPPR
jgi:hypothetical protein